MTAALSEKYEAQPLQRFRRSAPDTNGSLGMGRLNVEGCQQWLAALLQRKLTEVQSDGFP